MFKGKRTYIAGAAGVFTGLGMLLNVYLTGDTSHLGESLILIFGSLTQMAHRASGN